MNERIRKASEWFQRQVVRRIDWGVLMNAYHQRRESGEGSTVPAAQRYKRQATVYREKSIDDWKTAVAAATDPDDPRRGLLYTFYQALYRDEHLQTTIDNRVLPIQQSEFRLVDKNGNEDSEAAGLLRRPWFHDLIRIYFLHRMQGVSLVDLSHLNADMEIDYVEEIPMSNFIPQRGIILREEYDTAGWSYREGALEPYYVQFGNAWSLGMLNELAIILLAKKLGMGSWMNYIEKYGVPPVFVISDRQDKKRMDDLFEMMIDFRNNYFGILAGQERVEYGKEAGGNTTDAFLPLEERCDNQVSKRLLGQTGTTENGAWDGTAKVHERVEKTRHESDKMLFMFYFNHVIIPKLVRISPVYRPLENLRLEWDDTETLDIREFIDAVVRMSPYYEFDIKELVERTGLPVTGMRGMSGESPVAPEPAPRPPVNPQKKKSEPGREKPGIADTVNALYYPDGNMPEAAGLSLEEKIRDRVLRRLAGKGFDVGKGIDPDLFAHTFDCLDKAVSKSFGKVEYGTPDYDFLEELRYNNAVFAAFKTHRQQNEIHARLFDEDGKRKDFDRFRKDTAGILQDYNVNWLRTEYDTAVRRARFAADFRSCRANKDLYPNLEWLPSVSATPREAHRVFYGQIRSLEDPFWNTNYPGNLWNCKCGIRSTDKPVNATGDAAPVPAAPGLDRNPATSGELFTESHPYIKGASKEAEKAVEEFVGPAIYTINGIKQIPVLGGTDMKINKIVADVENEIRMNKSHETGMVIDKNGKILVDKRGESFRVKFTDGECDLMKDAVVTHNHPRGWGYGDRDLGRMGNSFSMDDLSLAVYNDVAEIRAVTPNYTFSLKRPEKGWGVDIEKLISDYSKEDRKLKNEFGKRIQKGTLTVTQANATHYHILAKRICKKYGWEYMKGKTR